MRQFWTVINPTKKNYRLFHFRLIVSVKYSHHLDLLHYWLHKRDFASIFIQCLYQRVNPIACYLDLLQAGNITFSHAKIWGVPEPRKRNTEISVAPFNASVRERSGLLFFKTFLMWIHVRSGAKLINMQTWPKWRWNESDKY